MDSGIRYRKAQEAAIKALMDGALGRPELHYFGEQCYLAGIESEKERIAQLLGVQTKNDNQ